MQEIYRVIARLMGTDLTVMINGESGTGKELVARAMHDYGKRRGGPFVAVNMAAIPRELIESELFGHEKGAFTGANARKIGRFEQAEGGTLFLDEIGDMPLEAQTRLLRVLQSGEFMPVGGRTPIRADLRIIAATHRDLRQLVAQGLFREDLFYRLNVVPIRLPPLRERGDDIPALVQHFLVRARLEGLPPKTIEPEAMVAPQGPRLARQRARAREPGPAPGRALRPGDDRRRGDRGRAARGGAAGAAAGPRRGDGRSLGDSDRAAISSAIFERARRAPAGRRPARPDPARGRAAADPQVLAATRGNQIKAAALLGLNRNTLRKKIRELDIEVDARATMSHARSRPTGRAPWRARSTTLSQPTWLPVRRLAAARPRRAPARGGADRGGDAVRHRDLRGPVRLAQPRRRRRSGARPALSRRDPAAAARRAGRARGSSS